MKRSNGALEARASQALTTSFTEYQLSSIIADCESRITKLSVQLQALEEPRQKAFDEYEKLQNQYDAVKTLITQDNNLLSQMSHLKNGLGKIKPLRVMRGSSHNDMKEKEKTKLRSKPVRQFTWTAYAAAVLRKSNRMMHPEDIWDKVVEGEQIAERAERLGQALSSLKWGAINACWLKNVEVTTGGGRFAEKRGLLFQHDGLLGLKEWATEDWKPKPEHKADHATKKAS